MSEIAYKDHGDHLPAYAYMGAADELRVLKWSGKDVPPPAIGAEVTVYMNDFGPVKVTGYFEQHGWLGFTALVLDPPAWWVKQNAGDIERGMEDAKPGRAHFFGVDLTPR